MTPPTPSAPTDGGRQRSCLYWALGVLVALALLGLGVVLAAVDAMSGFGRAFK
jgi:hypothetical protein